MDIVYIKDLEVKTVIGVYDWERKLRQPVSIDLDMAWDNTKAAATDDVVHALDYKSVCDKVTAFVESSGFQLIETMAEQIAALVRKEFGVPWLRVRVGKPAAITGAKDVGVIIERGVKPSGVSA
ncbi:MAG: dihydroneopterin aldolase [Pseudomonadota bacterium]